MTISERKALLEAIQPPPCPGEFLPHWQEIWASAAPEDISRQRQSFANPAAIYENITVKTALGSIRARYLRPAGAQPVPTVLMYHDLSRPVRGWHHMTRFAGLGYAVLALENPEISTNFQDLSEKTTEKSLISALIAARTALTLAHGQPLFTWGEGFGGSLSLAAAAMLPEGAFCAALNPMALSGLTACFARHLKKPLLLGTCLMDSLSPPEGQYGIFNSVPGEKQQKTYPKYGHERVNAFENEVLKFFHIGG